MPPSKLAVAAAAVAAKCTTAAGLFGAALGGLTASEVACAYGHVVSRAFAVPQGDSSSIALLPVVDMLNHLAGSSIPLLWQPPPGDDDSGDAAAGEQQQQQQQQQAQHSSMPHGVWCVWPQQLTEWDVRGAELSRLSGGSSTAPTAEGARRRASDAGGAPPVPPRAADLVMRAGEELFISYMSRCSPEAALLSFGFVPPELKGLRPRPPASAAPL
jgi:hypothetical protein